MIFYGPKKSEVLLWRFSEYDFSLQTKTTENDVTCLLAPEQPNFQCIYYSPNLQGRYIIAPEELRTPKMQKFIGTSFTFYFKRLNRGYARQAKHLRQTFITAVNQYANRVSLTHSSFRITEKHYIDRSAIAVQLAKSGFRIFEKDTPSIKKKPSHNRDGFFIKKQSILLSN